MLRWPANTDSRRNAARRMSRGHGEMGASGTPAQVLRACWEALVGSPLAGTGPLEDRAAGRDFNRGNAPCVQHQEPIAVSTAEHARILRKGADDVVDDLAYTPRTAVVVRHVHAVAANEPDTKHKPFHASQSRRAQRPAAMNLRGRGTVPSAAGDRAQPDPHSQPGGRRPADVPLGLFDGGPVAGTCGYEQPSGNNRTEGKIMWDTARRPTMCIFRTTCLARAADMTSTPSSPAAPTAPAPMSCLGVGD